jgi:hypothetical protein
MEKLKLKVSLVTHYQDKARPSLSETNTSVFLEVDKQIS